MSAAFKSQRQEKLNAIELLNLSQRLLAFASR